jgi:hypothetical protein
VVVGRLDGATALVTEHIMSGYAASGVGAPVPSSIGSGATLETRNGRTTLSFTASAIAAQPLNVMGADSIIVARGSSNVWAYHAERGTAVVDWTSRASPAPSVSRAPSASPTISPTAGAIAYIYICICICMLHGPTGPPRFRGLVRGVVAAWRRLCTALPPQHAPHARMLFTHTPARTFARSHRLGHSDVLCALHRRAHTAVLRGRP